MPIDLDHHHLELGDDRELWFYRDLYLGVVALVAAKSLGIDTKDWIIVWIKTGFAIFFSPSSWQDTAMVRIKKCLYSVY